MFNTLKNYQLHSKVVAPFYVPTRNEDFSCSTSLLIKVVIYYNYGLKFIITWV